MQRRRESYDITDIKLADSHKVIAVAVNYQAGVTSWLTGERGQQGIHIGTTFCEKSGGMCSFQMFGDTHLKTLVVPMERFNAKKLEEVAADIKANGEKSILYGEAYKSIIDEMAKRNKVTIARDEAEAWKPETFTIGNRVRVLSMRHTDERGDLATVVAINEPADYRAETFETITDDATMFSFSYEATKLERVDEPDWTAEQIAARREQLKASKAEIDRKEAEQKAEFEKQISKNLAQLMIDYPWAKQEGRDYARASANLKLELRSTWPQVAFSVTSESHTGGSSIRIRWVNGPTDAQVDEIAKKYQYTYYTENDILSDGTSYKNDAMHKAVDQWLGSAKYVSCARSVSEDVREEVRVALLDYFNGIPSEVNNVHSVTAGAEIFGKFKEFTTTEKGYLTAVFEKPEPVEGEPATVEAGDITVKENPTLGGIEIKFASRPDESIIEQVKRYGFRWSRRQHLWYAKANETRRNFAFSLV
jgi:hypothetical protein